MFMNNTEVIGQVMNGLTVDVTGAPILTFLFIVFMVMIIAVILRLSFELIIILLTPLILVLMAYQSDFIILGVLWLILDAVIIAKNILIK